jgi:hypothetical protein
MRYLQTHPIGGFQATFSHPFPVQKNYVIKHISLSPVKLEAGF